MKAVIAARSHALIGVWCECCGNRRRCALLYLVDAADKKLRICGGCARALLFAARSIAKKKARRP